MCQAPSRLLNGLDVACHKCPQCIDLRINDMVGRNIAESKTSVASHAVTLTYGRNEAGDVQHERAILLTYSDYQKAMKLLRWNGYKVRYIVTGEFGGLKGRTHWHTIWHWQSKPPVVELNKMVHVPEWTHGHTLWKPATPQSMRYVCKYINKDQGDAEVQGLLAMSKCPPLGAAYFARMAWKHAEQGIAPQTLDYNFPDVKYGPTSKRAGQRVSYRLTGKSGELFLEEFGKAWLVLHPNTEVPHSKLVEEYFDRSSWAERVPGVYGDILIQKGPRHPFKPAMDLNDWRIAWENWQNEQARRQGRVYVPTDEERALQSIQDDGEAKRLGVGKFYSGSSGPKPDSAI